MKERRALILLTQFKDVVNMFTRDRGYDVTRPEVDGYGVTLPYGALVTVDLLPLHYIA